MRILSAIILLTSGLVGVAPGQVIDKSSAPPPVIRAVAPLFPIPEKNSYAVGSVVVEIQVEADGSVSKAKAVQGHPLLYSASEKAAQRWLFASATAETKVRSAHLIFIFKLLEGSTAEEDLSPIFTPPYQIEVRREVPVIETREP
jgi:outer membrane biosynthesis protein TonB